MISEDHLFDSMEFFNAEKQRGRVAEVLILCISTLLLLCVKRQEKS